jgi:adenylate cyclase
MALLIDSLTPEHTLSARRLLEESVRLNPQSADTWSQLANVLVSDYLNHWNEAKENPEAGKDLLRRAESSLREALKIDPSVALAHYVEGLIHHAKGDHPAALDAFDRGVQLDPNFARAYAQKANQFVLVGRPMEAPPLVLKAITLSPRDPSIGVFYWVMGRAYFVMKDYEHAIIWLQKSVEVRPNLWFSRAYLLSAYALTGRHQQDEARAALNEYNRLFSEYTMQHIGDIYEKELPQTDPGVQASIQELYKGLRLIKRENAMPVFDAIIRDEKFRKSFEEDRLKVIASLNLSSKEAEMLESLDVESLVKRGTSVRDALLREMFI